MTNREYRLVVARQLVPDGQPSVVLPNYGDDDVNYAGDGKCVCGHLLSTHYGHVGHGEFMCRDCVPPLELHTVRIKRHE